MSSPTNLTDRISHLRKRKGSSDIVSGQRLAGKPPSTKKPNRERRFATDIFMLFAYSLLGIATLCQLVLIIWLDII